MVVLPVAFNIEHHLCPGVKHRSIDGRKIIAHGEMQTVCSRLKYGILAT
jgi:hypothetical protein